MSPLPPVDWSRPWLAPYRRLGQRAADAAAGGLSVADALNRVACSAPGAARSGGVRFVAASGALAGGAYECHVRRTGCVPTRDDLHDFFNGLVWLHRPALKRRLNDLHAAAIEREGCGPRRGRLRDAATLLDENGALLDAPADLLAALRRHDWHAAFVAGRRRWRHEVSLTLVGHALLAKLCTPYKAITAHAAAVPADRIDAGWLAAHPFDALPVLGVPGWWSANEDPSFYGDAAVFRPSRRAAPPPHQFAGGATPAPPARR